MGKTNIAFCYKYQNRHGIRGGAVVVFRNPENADPLKLLRAIRKADSAGGDGWFVPHDVRIQSLYPWEYSKNPIPFDEEADGCWHVADYMANADRHPTDPHNRTATEFVKEYLAAAKRGWDEFDPPDRPICETCGTENDPRNPHCRECGSALFKRMGGFGQGT